jgi:hypothetical protein
MEEETKVTIYMLKELKKRIHRQAISESLTLSKMINKAVTEYLDKTDGKEMF